MTQTATPIFLSPADRDFTPHRYVMHIHSQKCRCGRTHEHSEFYAKTHIRSTLGHKFISNLRPITRPEEIAFNLPIDVVKLEPKAVMFCSECINTATLSHLPTPPHPEPRIVSGAQDEPADKPKPKKSEKPFTIDDL